MKLGSSIRRRRHNGQMLSGAYRISRRTLSLMLLIIFTGFGIGYIWATNIIFPVPPTPQDLFEVPNVRGVDFLSATRVINAVGLQVSVVDSFSHPTVDRDQVLGQNPLDGQLAIAGDTVGLTLSLGPVRRPVPDVIPLRKEWARNILEASGFTVTVDSLDTDLPSGQVVEVIPEPGTEVDLPMEVRIAVSTGPSLITMPLLLGIEQDVAEAKLDSLGFVVSEILTRFRFGRDQGRVVEQNPPADSLLAPGSSVRLVVGRRSTARRNIRD